MKDAQGSKIVKIHIEKYEEDLNIGPGKEKKNDIIDLFTNYNKIRSEEELYKIESSLHIACQKGDLELIKIYLSETITINDFIFKIDRENQTASFFYLNDYLITDLVIPRTVRYESTDYLITSLTGIGFGNYEYYELTTLKFAKDSSVETIYQHIFSNFSSLKEIYFPESLKELKEGWCDNVDKLQNIIIPPSNGRFIFKDEKYLLGKTDPNSDEFDNLLFVRRDIEEFSIPPNIKVISSYAFYDCEKLTKIEISPDSNLHSIGDYAFTLSKIEEINFPANLIELKENWCNGTEKLTNIIISPLNGQFIFKDEKYLLGKTDPNSDEFDNILFVRRDIEEFSIPSNIKVISSFAFHFCTNLTKVEIDPNSKLQIIGPDSFQGSGIRKIIIPPQVSKICEYAFTGCFSLIYIEIPPNSNLQTIGQLAFAHTNIESIIIPPKVSKICRYAFYKCENLKKIGISPNSNLQTIEEYAFRNSKIDSIFIPQKVSKIWGNTFSSCKNLKKVEFSPNSNLQKIRFNAFSFSAIESIFIPPKVSKICEKAFFCCEKLQIIEISEESELKSFQWTISNRLEKCLIMIPSKLRKLINTNEPI
ncbi:hypothetical protein M9Y10_025368 [Tritrichomonas musculus]|uniref:Surface antigen BspA-like n=1 Tax=Tritrichomonas musculus TaxID=1915356 RepID=A0ABR2HAA5_9EUKA